MALSVSRESTLHFQLDSQYPLGQRKVDNGNSGEIDRYLEQEAYEDEEADCDFARNPVTGIIVEGLPTGRFRIVGRNPASGNRADQSHHLDYSGEPSL
jgi:hypothetical protein